MFLSFFCEVSPGNIPLQNCFLSIAESYRYVLILETNRLENQVYYMSFLTLFRSILVNFCSLPSELEMLPGNAAQDVVKNCRSAHPVLTHYLVCRLLLRSSVNRHASLPSYFLLILYSYCSIFRSDSSSAPVQETISHGFLPPFFLQKTSQRR